MLAIAAVAHGETYVTADITSSTSWTPAGSPYIIQVDVRVTNDSTLSIQAGVTVAFDGDYHLEAGWGSAIIGTGVSGNGILFTSNAGSPAPSDWTWVEVSGPNPSSFSYCTFEFAQMGLRANSCDPTISHCTVRSCGSAGLFCSNASPTIQYCDIYANRDGIWINSGGMPIINYSNIHDNTNWNVYVMSYPEPAASIDAEDNWWGRTSRPRLRTRFATASTAPTSTLPSTTHRGGWSSRSRQRPGDV